jgi:hypothetical protein
MNHGQFEGEAALPLPELQPIAKPEQSKIHVYFRPEDGETYTAQTAANNQKKSNHSNLGTKAKQTETRGAPASQSHSLWSKEPT